MIKYYLVIFLTVSLISVGILLLKNPFFLFASATADFLNSILESKKDNSVKQNNLIQSLGNLLPKFGLFLFFLAIAIGISFIPLVVYLEYNPEKSIQDLDMRSLGFFLSVILGCAALFIAPWANRQKENDYSGWSMLLHRMVLNNYNISSALFRLEKRIYRKKVKNQDKDFVIVSGLARAGTNTLTSLLFETDVFHYLSYENMPFLLSVNLWKKLHPFWKNNLKKIDQSDTLMFGYRSVVALEEYFFKVFLKDAFISDDALLEHEVDKNTYENYITYQKLISNRKRETIYLAKNNNLILRFKSLRSYNPDFKIIIIFRHPVNQAWSLISQHERFSDMHEADPFTLEYMDWLGNHEFGLNHKVFDLELKDLSEPYERSSINYWIAIWISYYSYIQSLVGDKNLFLIEYADLCSRPNDLIHALGERLNLDLSANHRDPYAEHKWDQQDIDPVLLERSIKLYNEIRLHKVEVK